MGQFTLNGVVYEEMPDGQARIVGYAQQQPVTIGQRDPNKAVAAQQGVVESAADIARKNAELPYAGAQAEASTARAQQAVQDRPFERGDKLRDDFNAQQAVKDYKAALPSLMAGLNAKPDAGGDNALIYAYAKAMDPGSVVRESEMGMAAGTGSVFDSVAANLKKQFGIEGGGQLSPQVRENLKREMNSKVAQLAKSYGVLRSDFQSLAQRQGVNPVDVVGDFPARNFFGQYENIRPGAEQQAGEAPMAPFTPEEQATGLSGGGVTDNGDYGESVISQGLSGINQGIANTLGAPVDLMNMGLGLGASGINALTNSDLQVSDNPLLGSRWFGDQLRSAGSIGAESSDPTNQFVRRAGESLGGALIPVGATARTGSEVARALIPAMTGGIGAATAQQVAPGNPYAEIAAELLGGGAGTYGLARRGQAVAQQGIEAAIPTVPQLKTQASDLYDLAETRGMKATPTQTQNLADQMRDFAGNEGLLDARGQPLSAAYPKASQALKMVDSYAGGDMTPKQMQTVRKVLGDARNSTEGGEGRIAGSMLGQFDDWTAPLAPELADARSVASRYLQAQELEKARKLAEVRAGQFSQSGMENALRTEYRGLERADINGRANFRPEVVSAIENVAEGSTGANAARFLGKFAPKGPVSALGGAGIGAAVGSAVGSPMVGGVAGALLSGAGYAGARTAEKMTDRAATVAELIARNGGDISQAPIWTPEIERIIAANLFGNASSNLSEN